MSQIQPPNIDEIKRQAVVSFLAEMQDLKQTIELEFSSRFDEQKNNFLATSKASYSPQEIGNIFDTIKSLEMENMKQILTTTSGNGSKVLGKMLGSALTGNLSFSGEATQRIAELEQENTRLKAEIIEKDKAFEDEQSKIQERGEGQIDELNRLQEQVDDQKRTIEMYEKQVMEHGETLAQQRIEIEDLQSQVGDESSEKDGLQSLLQEKEDLLQENEKIISNMKEQMTSLEKRVQQMKSVSTEKFEAETGRLEETLNMERERADDLEVRVKEASTAIDNYKQALTQKDEEIDKLRKTVTDTKSKVASEETEKEAQIRTLTDEKKALEHQVTDIKNTLDLSEKKVESLTADLTGKDGIVDNKDKEISDLKKQLAEAKDSISAEKSSQESKMNELLKDKTKHEAEINEFKNEIRDLKKALEDKEKITSEVTKTQEVIEKDRDALQEERDKIMVQFENMKTRLTELESSTTQKDTLIKSLTKSLQSVPKFRVFLAIQDIGGEISIPDLAKIVGQPSDVVEHIVSDLRDDGLVKVAKKENKTFVTKV
jgi:chromosome segregation ATPase